MKWEFVVIAALVVESAWETLKMVWQEGKVSPDRVGAIVVGLIVAFAWPVDLFVMVNRPFAVPFVGMLLSGIIFSRGANFAHDLFKLLESFSVK